MFSYSATTQPKLVQWYIANTLLIIAFCFWNGIFFRHIFRYQLLGHLLTFCFLVRWADLALKKKKGQKEKLRFTAVRSTEKRIWISQLIRGKLRAWSLDRTSYGVGCVCPREGFRSSATPRQMPGSTGLRRFPLFCARTLHKDSPHVSWRSPRWRIRLSSRIEATVGGVPPIFTPGSKPKKGIPLYIKATVVGGTLNFHPRVKAKKGYTSGYGRGVPPIFTPGSKPKKGIPIRSRLR